MTKPRPKQMTRREAQILAAIVFLTKRHSNMVSVKTLMSLIYQQRREKGWCVIDVKFWQKLNNTNKWNQHFAAYFADKNGLATTVMEAKCILALHHWQNTDIRSQALICLTAPGFEDIPEAEKAYKYCRAKDYIEKTDRGLVCSARAFFELPYLRILARNFQTARRRIVQK